MLPTTCVDHIFMRKVGILSHFFGFQSYGDPKVIQTEPRIFRNSSASGGNIDKQVPSSSQANRRGAEEGMTERVVREASWGAGVGRLRINHVEKGRKPLPVSYRLPCEL